ncbi:S-layer homology domain-containing protein [Alkaliphilus serpentinus]|uniref:S-layer homology domain-containing protein n=1 Tax=Alkaliphilus serpentinus TaxID=1482731 RepID=A0A833HRX8_9FIRM|nr:S-layer homology domain-containing protein [Alkaliphilus serpentinus]KAB3532727.1 S-layer homology domain-containing protein [Alkaliphilus serpentinus]
MKKIQKSFVALFIVLMLLFSSLSAFSQSLIFTDISDHWARGYIEDVYNRKITSGYQDATFRPNNYLTSLDAISMVANLLGYSSSNHQATAEESRLYTGYNIPSWAHGHVSFLVSKEIVEENELNQFVTGGNTNNIKRFIFATYIGKVLVEYGDQELSKTVSLPYKDDMFIPAIAKPYVDLMLKLEILNKDSNGGKFEPNNQITRAEAAKLISLTAKLLDEAEFEAEEGVTSPKQPVTEEETDVEEPEVVEEPTAEEVVVEEKEGTIDQLVKGNRIVITIKNDKDILIYDVSKDAAIFLDDEESNIEAIKNGQDVKLKLENGIVVEIRAVALREVFSGFYEKLLKGSTNTVLTLSDSKGTKKVFVIPEDLLVSLNGEDSTFDSFEVGDVVKLFAKEDRYIEAQGESKTEFIRGTITYLGSPSNPVIEITQNDETKITLEMEKNTAIRRDGKVSDFSKLKVSDEVHIELEYDKAKIVNASTQRRTAEGYIRKIVIGEESYVVVESSDNVLEEFIIADYTTIRMGSEAAEIYDLRLNYFAEIDIESNEVIRLETSERVETERYIGVITYIHDEQKIIEIEYEENGKIITKQINTKKDTIYLGQSGTTTFSKLDVGDELLIIGQTDQSLFIAERIIVVLPN